jgi:hypothetical protein
MALSPLATPADLAAWTGETIDSNDARAEAVLSFASALVRAYTGETWDSDDDAAPAEVCGVVVQAAARVWGNPKSLESLTVDDTTPRWGSAGTMGVYLTEADKDILGRYVTGGPSDIGSIGLSVNGGPTRDTVFVPTGPPPAGYPFPWYSADELWP